MARELTYTIQVLSEQAEAKVRRMEDAFKNAAKAAGSDGFAKAERELERATRDAERAADKLNLTIAKQKDAHASAAKEVEGFDRQTQALIGTLSKVAAAVGISFSVTALVNFGQAIVENIGKINDLHDATGVATGDLQRLAYVGAGAGLNMDTLGRAVGTLSERLAKGDASAVGAVQSLGLSLNTLIAAGPTEAFVSIGEAVSRIEDPMQKNAIAAELFGDKLGRKLIPMLGDLRSELAKVPDAAIVPDEDIKAIDELGDAWDRAKVKLEAYVARSVTSFFKPTREQNDRMGGTDYANALALAGVTDVQLPGSASSGAISTADMLANRLKALRTEAVEPLTTAQKANIVELKRLGENEAEIARLVGASAVAVHRYVEAERDAATSAKKHSVELEREAALLSRIAVLNQEAAAGLVKRPEYNPAGGTLPEVDRIKAIVAAQEAMGKLRSGKSPFGMDAQSIEAAIAGSGAFGIENVGTKIERVISERTHNGFADAVFELPRLIQNALTGGGGMKGAFKAFGSMIGGTVGEGLFKAGGLLNGLGNKLTGVFGDAFGLALPGIGNALGSLIGPLIGKLFSIGGPSKQELAGRDLERTFERSFGSFDKMMAAVGKAYDATGLGAERARADVEALLAAERQGPEATQRWIDRINEVMNREKAMADAAKAALETLPGALNDIIVGSLEPQIQAWDDLAASIADAKKAGRDVTDLLKRQREAAAGAKDELEFLGQAAVTAFSVAYASGKSFVDALSSAGPGLDALIKAYQDLGIEGSDAFLNILMAEQQMAKAQPALMKGVASLAPALKAEWDLGILNPDSFKATQDQAMRMFSRLQGEAAKTTSDVGQIQRLALIPMQEYLHQAEQAAKDLGVPLDENTQILINQSKELGIWKDKGKSSLDIMTDAVKTLVDKLTLFLDKLGLLPKDVNVNVNTNYSTTGQPPQLPDVGVGSGQNTPGDPNWTPDYRTAESGIPGFSRGTPGLEFKDFGAGQLAVLHGKEAVVPFEAMSDFVMKHYPALTSGDWISNPWGREGFGVSGPIIDPSVFRQVEPLAPTTKYRDDWSYRGGDVKQAPSSDDVVAELRKLREEMAASGGSSAPVFDFRGSINPDMSTFRRMVSSVWKDAVFLNHDGEQAAIASVAGQK